MNKIDFKKEYKELYAPLAKKVTIVDIPAFNYLMIDGQGEPDCIDAQETISTLFPVAYTIKFMFKKREKEYAVMPLEGLWWSDDMNDFVDGKKDKWKWTYMIMQPDFVTKADFEKALEDIKKKKELPALKKIRFELLKENKVAQIMHIGPFAEEGLNITKIHNYIHELGGTFDGHKEKHHEIYLNDIRKVNPQKMKTILRQPFHI